MQEKYFFIHSEKLKLNLNDLYWKIEYSIINKLITINNGIFIDKNKEGLFPGLAAIFEFNEIVINNGINKRKLVNKVINKYTHQELFKKNL